MTQRTLVPLASVGAAGRPYAAGAFPYVPGLYPPSFTTGAFPFVAGSYEVFRASGLAHEVTFATNLGDLPPLRAAFAGTLTGLGANVTVADNLLRGDLPLSATIAGLVEGQEYVVRVAADNGLPAPPGGAGPWSRLASAIPRDVPHPPRDLRLAPQRRVYEVQRVWATAARVLAVQSITTSADSVVESQTVQTSAPAGTALGGTFGLSFNGVSTAQGFFGISIASDVALAPGTGGAFRIVYFGNQPTGCIPWDAPAEGADSVAASIEALPGAPITYAASGLRVKRVQADVAANPATGAPASSTTTYLIYGAGVGRLTVTLDFDQNGVADCAAFAPAPLAPSPTAAVTVSGAFVQRAGLQYNVAPADLAARLEEHPDLVSVNVVASLPTDSGGLFYTIAFAAVADSRFLNPALPLLTCDGSALVSTAPNPAAAQVPGSCSVVRDVARNIVGGTFALTYTDRASGVALSTASLASDASASDVEAALEAALFPLVNPTAVERTALPDAQGGYTWRVTFVTAAGPVPLLQATSALIGSGASATVANVVVGNELGGVFTLRYGPRETRPIAWNASATDLAAALEALAIPPVEVVHVTRGAAFTAPAGGVATAPPGEGASTAKR